MKKIDRHIYFSNEEFNRIVEYQEKTKLSLSDTVCHLSMMALNSEDIIDKITTIESDINYIIKKLKYISLLNEQIYSDMDFDNVTNPKKSKSLNEFQKKIRNNSIND